MRSTSLIAAASLALLLALWCAASEAPAPVAVEPAAQAAAVAPEPPADLRGDRVALALEPSNLAVGDVLDHACELELGSEVNDRDGLRRETVAIRGGLRLEVLARAADETILRARFRDIELVGEAGRLREAFDAPVFVRVDRSGDTLAYAFPEQVPLGSRNSWRAVFDALRVVVPDGAAESWTAIGGGVDGPQRDHYARRDGDVLERTRERAPHGEPLVKLHGRAEIELLGERWWRRVVSEDRSTLELEGLRVESWFRARVELVERSTSEVHVELDDLVWSSVDGTADAHVMAGLRRRQQFAERLDGVGLETLVARALASGSSREELELLELLAWKLRLDPGAIERLRALLLEQSLPDETVGLLVDALMEAGNEACQRLAADLLATSALPAELRDSIALAAFALREPAPQFVDALAELYGRVGLEPALRPRLLLLLGALSERVGDDSHALASLLAREAEAAANGELVAWLHGLANSGSAHALEAFGQYVAHEDPVVRATVAGALLGLPADGVVPLAWELVADESLLVREPAATALAAFLPAHELAALASLLQHEPEPTVRQAVVEGLAGRSDSSPAAQELLHALSVHDPSPEVRDLAFQVLAHLFPG